MSNDREIPFLTDSAFFPTVEDFIQTEAGYLWSRIAGNDLHDMVRHYGHESVAADCETGVRSLKAWLCGANQPQPDSLYRMRCIHPDFSCDKTILHIGFKRELRGNMKQTLERPPMGFAAMAVSDRVKAARSRSRNKADRVVARHRAAEKRREG